MSDFGITLYDDPSAPGLSLGPAIPGPSISLADLSVKSGTAIPAQFVGKLATVLFDVAYPDSNYVVTMDAVVSGGGNYSPTAENKTPSGFTIDLGSANLAGLVEVGWQAMPKTE